MHVNCARFEGHAAPNAYYRVRPVALPLIAVRLLYSLIGDFSDDTTNQFSIVNDSPEIQLAMATIEELLVVLMFAILGVFTPRAATPGNYDASRAPNPHKADART
jgi:hypothetical protein